MSTQFTISYRRNNATGAKRLWISG